MPKDDDLRENIKIAFSKVKEHILDIEKEIKAQKEELIKIKEQIHTLKQEINSSTGNKGDLQQAINKQSTSNQHTYNTSYNIKSLKNDIINTFKTLTDKEFLIFLTIYQLEEEYQRPVKYLEIAKKLSLSQSFVRGSVSELFVKGIPIEKIKKNNRQVSLSIKKDFKSLNLVSDILNLQHSYNTLTTYLNEEQTS